MLGEVKFVGKTYIWSLMFVTVPVHGCWTNEISQYACNEFSWKSNQSREYIFIFEQNNKDLWNQMLSMNHVKLWTARLMLVFQIGNNEWCEERRHIPHALFTSIGSFRGDGVQKWEQFKKKKKNFRNAKGGKMNVNSFILYILQKFCGAERIYLQWEGKMASKSEAESKASEKHMEAEEYAHLAGKGAKRWLHKFVKIIIVVIQKRGNYCDVFFVYQNYSFVEKVSVANWKYWKLIWKNAGRKRYWSHRDYKRRRTKC